MILYLVAAAAFLIAILLPLSFSYIDFWEYGAYTPFLTEYSIYFYLELTNTIIFVDE
jgi:hypothetical protein